MGDLAKQLRAGLSALLAEIGTVVAAKLPEVRWHAEFPESRAYDLIGLLIFTSCRDTETELVVVTVQHAESGGWSMDVTDRESLPLLDEFSLQWQDEYVDPNDSGKIVDHLRTMLQPMTERIVSELSP